MSLIIYRNSRGEIFKIPAGVPFKKGADWERIGVEKDLKLKKLDDTFIKMANALGRSVDEVITHSAKALGIEKCSRCEMRSKILRRMGELGWVETVRRLRATFNAS